MNDPALQALVHVPMVARLLRDWMARNSRKWSGFAGSYRPEFHYMRRPGPRTLEKNWRKLRLRSHDVTAEQLPERWGELLKIIERRSTDA
jgi:hypothetical protein